MQIGKEQKHVRELAKLLFKEGLGVGHVIIKLFSCHSHNPNTGVSAANGLHVSLKLLDQLKTADDKTAYQRYNRVVVYGYDGNVKPYENVNDVALNKWADDARAKTKRHRFGTLPQGWTD